MQTWGEGVKRSFYMDNPYGRPPVHYLRVISIIYPRVNIHVEENQCLYHTHVLLYHCFNHHSCEDDLKLHVHVGLYCSNLAYHQVLQVSNHVVMLISVVLDFQMLSCSLQHCDSAPQVFHSNLQPHLFKKSAYCDPSIPFLETTTQPAVTGLPELPLVWQYKSVSSCHAYYWDAQD